MPTPVVAMGNRKSGMDYRPAGSSDNQAKGRTPHQQIPQPTNALSQQDSPTFPTGREDKKASYPPHAVPLAPLPVLHEITEEFIQRMEHYGEEPRLAADDDQHEVGIRLLRWVNRVCVEMHSLRRGYDLDTDSVFYISFRCFREGRGGEREEDLFLCPSMQPMLS